jgi:sulfur carrier protein
VPDPIVNGEPRPVTGWTVRALLEDLGVADAARGLAVAIDGEVAPRSTWDDRRLAEDERVEVVSAMQGG